MYLNNLWSIPGVAKLLDYPSHFSKFDIFCEQQLNTFLNGMKKGIKNDRNYIYLKHINKSTKYVY